MKFFEGDPIPSLPVVLNHLAAGVDFRLQDDSDGHGPYPTRNLDQVPTEAAIRAAEQGALVAAERRRLVEYAEERGLRRGALLRDPDDDSAVVDPGADLETIRRATNRLRVKVIERSRRGAAGVKAKAQAIRAAEDDIAVAVYDTTAAILAGTITTESEIDAAIDAVVLP